jgi:hypothetical protein
VCVYVCVLCVVIMYLYSQEDSSDEDEARVVLSASDKLRAAIGDTVRGAASLVRGAIGAAGSDGEWPVCL